MKKEWFESWFESDLYDMMYKHRDDEEAEAFLSNLLKHLKPTADASFLDLACGTGRHARFINSLGFHVVGVDLSQRKISIASKHAQENLEFYIQDMRKPMRINYFDFVLNLFTSFGYFDDIRDNYRVLKSVKSSLKSNGTFLIDYMNGYFIEKNLVKHEKKEYDDWTVDITRVVEDKRLIKTMHWSNGEIERNYSEKVTLFSLADFTDMLDKFDFKINHVFGDYKLNDFDLNHSPRLIIESIC